MRILTILTITIAVLLSVAPRSHAQLEDAGEILRSGTADANLLLENYLDPFATGFGAGLNTGWTNTAKPIGKFGFDLRAGASIALVPGADELFNVSDLSFQTLEHLGGPAESPTIAGDDTPGSELGQTYTYTHPATGDEMTEELFRFTMPQGAGFPYVPSPTGQLSVGLIKDTEVNLRYMPKIDLSDVGSVGLWGLGVKHGINQWFPDGGLLPVDISVQFGYTSLTADASFEVEPQVDNDTENSFPDSAWEGQGIELNSSGTVFNVLVGKTIPVFSVFGGLGIQSSTMTIVTPGRYPLTVPNEDFDPRDPDSKSKQIESIEEPIDLELSGDNSVHALAGFRIRLAILTFSASYTLSNYPVANVGVGLSFR